jgi:hypoxanthine phosphoribosyltransferase
MPMDLIELQGVLDRSEQLVSPQEVEQALDRLAGQVAEHLAGRDPLVLCVMNGGVIPAGLLLPRLGFALRLEYVHATRYRGATSGGELHWLHRPAASLQREQVLVIDDVFDEGLTLEAIVADCAAQGAARVYSLALVEKRRARACRYRPDFIGLEVEDRYLFGCGMDYKGYLRNYPGIAAVADGDR